jgi:hypothetical protein
LSSVTAKLNDANYFSLEKTKKAQLFWIWIQKNDQVWKINSLRNGEIIRFQFKQKGTLTLVKIK